MNQVRRDLLKGLLAAAGLPALRLPTSKWIHLESGNWVLEKSRRVIGQAGQWNRQYFAITDRVTIHGSIRDAKRWVERHA
jgi:hypothetical protein